MTDSKSLSFSRKTASPCPLYWENLAGNQRVRICSLCQNQVYNLNSLDSSQAKELILEVEGQCKSSLFQRKDGTFMTQDCSFTQHTLFRKTKLTVVTLAMLFLILFASYFAYLPHYQERQKENRKSRDPFQNQNSLENLCESTEYEEHNTGSMEGV